MFSFFYVFSCRLQNETCKYEMVQIHQVFGTYHDFMGKQVRVYVPDKLQ